MEPAVRQRLLENALLELEQRGRDGMAVERLLARADVDEDDFSAVFGDLDRCLDDAYEELTGRLEWAVRERCHRVGGRPEAPRHDWPSRVRAGLEALLSSLAAQPRLAVALTTAYPSLGSAQQARYYRFVARFEPLLAAGRRFVGADVHLPENVETLAVGATEAIVFDQIQAGKARELEQLGPSILFSVLVPFLGPEGAGAEMARAEQSRPETGL
jgi:AcrR family transcriptional regulator